MSQSAQVQKASDNPAVLVPLGTAATPLQLANEYQPYILAGALPLPWVRIYTSAVLPLPSSSGQAMLKSLKKTCDSKFLSLFNKKRCAALQKLNG
jgi:hypothetical protein